MLKAYGDLGPAGFPARGICSILQPSTSPLPVLCPLQWMGEGLQASSSSSAAYRLAVRLQQHNASIFQEDIAGDCKGVLKYDTI